MLNTFRGYFYIKNLSKKCSIYKNYFTAMTDISMFTFFGKQAT